MIDQRESDLTFVRRAFIIIALAALTGVLWALADILLLLFGSILFAVLLHTAGSVPQKLLGLGHRASLLAGGVVAIVVVGGAAAYLGPALVHEIRSVIVVLPQAADRIAGNLQLGSLASVFSDGTAASALGSLATRVIAWSSTIVGAIASLLLIIFGGIYLAVNPRLYRDGLVKLFPRRVQPNVDATLDDAGAALQFWLQGQLLAMFLVGTFTGLGLYLVGVPSALALGFLAGIAEFVPIVGPIVAAVPAVLIASTVNTQTALLALSVLVVVQQVESNLITPLIADRMVSIAPAVALFAIVAIGVLLGPIGLVFGFPLAIVCDVVIRRLYVRDTLGEHVELIGRRDRD